MRDVVTGAPSAEGFPGLAFQTAVSFSLSQQFKVSAPPSLYLLK